MDLDIFLKGVIGTLLYSFLGIVIMISVYVFIDKMTKFSIKKELIEDENVALGVMFGCFFIAIAIIIAAAII